MDQVEEVTSEEEPKQEQERKHFSDCYLLNYPDDEGVYCTCLDWSPDI